VVAAFDNLLPPDHDAAAIPVFRARFTCHALSLLSAALAHRGSMARFA
jgi:hypothetical protein